MEEHKITLAASPSPSTFKKKQTMVVTQDKKINIANQDEKSDKEDSKAQENPKLRQSKTTKADVNLGDFVDYSWLLKGRKNGIQNTEAQEYDSLLDIVVSENDMNGAETVKISKK